MSSESEEGIEWIEGGIRVEHFSPPEYLPIWKMIHTPLMEMYKDLDNALHSATSLLESIISNCNGYKDILIPPEETDDVVSQNYTGFTMWLMGRLFYLLSSEVLYPLSDLCLKAQLEILQILCSSRYSVFLKLLSEYHNTMKDILSVQKSKTGKGIYLRRFIADVDSDMMSHINLEQISVEMTDIKIQNRLLTETLKLLVYFIQTECVFENDMANKIWIDLMESLDIASPIIKCYSLEAAFAIVERSNSYTSMLEFCLEFCDAFGKFLKNEVNLDELLSVPHELSLFSDKIKIIISSFNISDSLNDDRVVVSLFEVMKLLVPKWKKFFPDELVDLAGSLAVNLLKRNSSLRTDKVIEKVICDSRTQLSIIHLLEWALYEDIINFVSRLKIASIDSNTDVDTTSSEDDSDHDVGRAEHVLDEAMELEPVQSKTCLFPRGITYVECAEVRENITAVEGSRSPDSLDSGSCEMPVDVVSPKENIVVSPLSENILVKLEEITFCTFEKLIVDVTRIQARHFVPARYACKPNLDSEAIVEANKESNLEQKIPTEPRGIKRIHELSKSGTYKQARMMNVMQPGSSKEVTEFDFLLPSTSEEEKSIVPYKPDIETKSQKTKNVFCDIGSLTWGELLDKLLETVKDLPHKADYNSFSTGLETMEMIVNCALEVSVMHESCVQIVEDDTIYVFIYFGGVLKHIVESCVKVITSSNFLGEFEEHTLNKFFKIFGSILQTSEIRYAKLEDIKPFITFLFLPWLDKIAQSSIVDTAMFEQCVGNALLVDNDSKIFTLRSLVHLPHAELDDLLWELINYSWEEVSLLVEVLLLTPVMITGKGIKPEKIFTDLLSKAFDSSIRDVNLQRVLSSIAGKLMCILNGRYQLVRQMVDGSVYFAVICVSCSSIITDLEICGTNYMDGLESQIERFFELLQYDDDFVQEKMMDALPLFIKHYPAFYKSKLLPNWFRLINAKQESVRQKFAGMVHYVLFEIQWITNKLNESESQSSCPLYTSKEDKDELKHSVSIFEKFMIQISTSAEMSLHSKDEGLQRSIILILKMIGRCPVPYLLLPCVGKLLLFIGHPLSMVQTFALHILGFIAEAHHTTVLDIYTKYKKEICNVVAGSTILLYNLEGPNFATSMQKIIHALGFRSFRDFLMKDGHHVFPILVPGAIKAGAVHLLLDIENCVKVNMKLMLEKTFQCIYPYVCVNEEANVRQQCFEYIQTVTGSSLHDLRLANFKIIHNELLLRYSDNPDRANDALRELAHDDPLYRIPQEPMSLNDIADYLKQRLLGALVYFESKLATARVGDGVKVCALKSLPLVIKLMGRRYITPMRFKILAMIRTAMKLNFQKLVLEIWDAFVRSVDFEQLGPLLSTIFASLLPLLEEYPRKIIKIFSYLIIDCRRQLSPFFKQLYFLEGIAQLHPIYQNISDVIATNGPMTLLQKLEMYTISVKHEDVDVRKHGLKFLKALLMEDQKSLGNYMGEEHVHPIIRQAMDALLSSFQNQDDTLRAGCLQCIGLIGAIDPARLIIRECQKACDSVARGVVDDKFAFQAIMHLARQYQTCRDAQSMDAFSLAIQLLMQKYSLSASETSVRKKNYWEQFPSDIKQILIPLQTSCYKNVVPPYAHYPHPIYGSDYGKTFGDWATNWGLRIMDRVLDDDIRSIFELSIISMKRDLQTLLFFLPFIVVHGIICSNESTRSVIIEELNAVICEPDKFMDVHEESKVGKSDFAIHGTKHKSPGIGFGSELQTLCAKTVFKIIDFVIRFLKDWTAAHYENYTLEVTDLAHSSLKGFLTYIDMMLLSKANYICCEYPRALMYLEIFVKENPEAFQHVLWLFLKIYARLNDPDAVHGIIAIREFEPTLEETMTCHKATGQFQEACGCEQLHSDEDIIEIDSAATYYENLDQESNIGSNLYTGLVECYLALDEPLTALRICQGIAAYRPEMLSIMEEFEAEAYWRLSDFGALTRLVENTVVPQENSWSMSLSHGILKFPAPRDVLLEQVNVTRRYLLDTINTISIEKGSYQEEYLAIVRAHIVAEIEQFREVVETISHTDDVVTSLELARNCMNDWDQRLQVVKQCAKFREPILCIRRSILLHSVCVVDCKHPVIARYFYNQVGKCWIDSATTARSEGQYQQAYSYMLNADNFVVKELFLERTKLLWEKGDKDTAFTVLRRGLKKHIPREYHDLNEYYEMVSSEDQKICAEGKLLLATYLDETVYVDTDASIVNYKNAVDACLNWEKSYVCLAQYYEKVLTSYKTPKARNVEGSLYHVELVFCYAVTSYEHFHLLHEIQVKAVENYAKSLGYGCEYIYKSLPCLLSLWLDLGTEYGDTAKSKMYEGSALRTLRLSLEKMNDIVRELSSTVPSFLFLPVYSQLISRVCHPDPEVFKIIKEIVILVLTSYPQQGFWMTVAVCKSTNQFCARRCSEILEAAALKAPDSRKFVADFMKLTDKFLELTETPLQESHKIDGYHTVSKIVPEFSELLDDPSFSNIILPLQKMFHVVYPKEAASYPGHHPYHGNNVYIVKLRDRVTVLYSLQKPRRIKVLGSDGKDYYILCKPKDDLRMDYRYMEFCTIVNRYLRKDEESRQRNLHIRTYCVAPLNEGSGLVEWVPDMISFYSTVMMLYRQAKIYNSVRLAKTYLEETLGCHEQLKKCFVEKVLPLYPDILDEWFTSQFPEPHKWYKARTAFSQTTAVMSMIGYILGLGDRHGDNILFDNVTGEVMHVDFNCLFNKGETFHFPEKVPFRMTHNMVAGMGPLGVEGIFRRCCEITLRLIRSHSDTLTSVLRPFIYDPIVSWNKEVPQSKSKKSENLPSTSRISLEYTNELAVKNLKDLERRLQGIVKIKGKECSIPLSVKGQVNSLILESTDIDNLCEMYVGWAPFL